MVEATRGDERLEEMAFEIVDGQGAGRSVRPFTGRDGGFAMEAAYEVAGRVHARRLARGERPTGRKIGFTNPALWPLFGAQGPMWGWMYEGTVCELASLPDGLSLAGLAKPRLEPEIALGLARVPEAGMDEAALMGCVGWVAHGFELVQSVHPAWAFAAADAVAAFGLHGALVLGERHEVGGDVEGWRAAISGLAVELRRDGAPVARGHAQDVVGGPLGALRFLADDLARRPDAPPLAAGEVVTTGTLTGAHEVAPGEVWTTAITGAPIQGLTLRLR